MLLPVLSGSLVGFTNFLIKYSLHKIRTHSKPINVRYVGMSYNVSIMAQDKFRLRLIHFIYKKYNVSISKHKAHRIKTWFVTTFRSQDMQFVF